MVPGHQQFHLMGYTLTTKDDDFVILLWQLAVEAAKLQYIFRGRCRVIHAMARLYLQAKVPIVSCYECNTQSQEYVCIVPS